VVTEGVFSMDGDRAPLGELTKAVERHDALLYLDDAHGAFVEGETGRGSPEAAGVDPARLFYMGTLGKALGCQGGFLAGPSALIRTLHNRARTFIYATALATPVAAAALEALHVLERDPAPQAQLAQRVGRLHAGLRRGAVPPSHIVPVIVGASRRARELSASLLERGHWAPAIRPPTVPEGAARLRLSVTALHTDEQIDQLVDALHDVTS